jgi:hypothetical protein
MSVMKMDLDFPGWHKSLLHSTIVQLRFPLTPPPENRRPPCRPTAPPPVVGPPATPPPPTSSITADEKSTTTFAERTGEAPRMMLTLPVRSGCRSPRWGPLSALLHFHLFALIPQSMQPKISFCFLIWFPSGCPWQQHNLETVKHCTFSKLSL